MRLRLGLSILPVCLALALPAFAQASFTPKPGEDPKAFALRAAGAPTGDAADDADAHVTPATWNGRPTIFVDYVEAAAPDHGYVEHDRMVEALTKMPDGSYRRSDVTDGEEEGGTASVAAIGFANADHDAAQELIVLLSWPVQHAIVGGTLYEVRIFDDIGATPPAELTYLKDVSKKFDKDSCDCSRPGEKDEHFPFQTVAAIKRQLKKLGY